MILAFKFYQYLIFSHDSDLMNTLNTFCFVHLWDITVLSLIIILNNSTYILTSNFEHVVEAIQHNLDNLGVFTIQQTEKKK